LGKANLVKIHPPAKSSSEGRARIEHFKTSDEIGG